MHELPARPLFFHPSCDPFTCSSKRQSLLCMMYSRHYPLKGEVAHCPLGIGTCKGSFSQYEEKYVLRIRGMATISEVELMLGFCPHVILYVPANFCILIFFGFCWWLSYAFVCSFSCITLPGPSSRTYRSCMVPIPKNQFFS